MRKGEKQVKVKKQRKRQGILVKILLAFIVPILLMVLLGSTSYRIASDIIISNYKNAKIDTMSAISLYADFMMDSVSSKTQELVNDTEVVSYYTKGADMESQAFSLLYKNIKANLVSAKTSMSGISALYIIGEGTTAKSDKAGSESKESGKSATIYDTYSVTPHSTAGDLSKDVYKKFMDTEEATLWSSARERASWYGYHTFLDEQAGVDPSSYAFTVVRRLSKGNGFIIADIKMSSITEILDQMNVEDGSVVALVTADGREIKSLASDDAGENIYQGISCFEDARQSKEDSGFSEITYKDTPYLFIYSHISDTNALVYSLIPEKIILNQVNSIKTITEIIVIIACVIALFIGIILALGISKNISGVVKGLAKASKGDMTVKFHTKRKDEFALLSNGLNEMLENIRTLLMNVSTVSDRVSLTARDVFGSTDKLLGATKDISKAIGEISEGNSNQAMDSENCVNLMSGLSEQIEGISMQSQNMDEISNQATDTVKDGMQIIGDLTEKAEKTTKITKVVIEGIEKLDEQSNEIYKIIDVINEISEQTNLLSLNASIEAARAGEAGKGFAVVADEIRKLADQSMQAVEKIRKIILMIQAQTDETVSSAKEAEQIVNSQGEALQSTIDVFHSIDDRVMILARNLQTIGEGMEKIDSAKNATVDVIQNISAVSQQTAATSEQVENTIVNQTLSVESLAEKAEDLAAEANNLIEAMKIFKV